MQRSKNLHPRRDAAAPRVPVGFAAGQADQTDPGMEESPLKTVGEQRELPNRLCLFISEM